MSKFYAKGTRMNYVNSTGSAIAAGTVLVVEDVAGVAEAAIPNGATGALSIEGVFDFVSSAAVAQGGVVYMDSSTKAVTGTSAPGLLAIGFALNAVTASGKTVHVKLANPVAEVPASPAPEGGGGVSDT